MFSKTEEKKSQKAKGPNIKNPDEDFVFLEDDEQEDIISQEEALAKISMILAKTENPESLSDLPPDEIMDMTIIKTLGTRLESGLMLDMVKNYLLLRVSNKRQGRKEIIQVASSGKHDDEKRGMGRFFMR